MKWSESIDAMNPANVPRSVMYQDQRWMPLEPVSQAQARRLQALLDEVGGNAPALFGDGFDGLDRISSWAASGAIAEMEALRDEQQSEERLLKAQMARILREKWPHLRFQQLPLRFCRKCEGMRPHDGYHCKACEVTHDRSA